MIIEKMAQKILHKIAISKVYSNLNLQLNKRNIKHAHVSRYAGRVDSAFNKSFKKNEDIRLSSFLRYIANINLELQKYKEAPLELNEICDAEVMKLLVIASELYIINLEDVIKEHHSFLQGLTQLDILIEKDRLSKDELKVVELIIKNM